MKFKFRYESLLSYREHLKEKAAIEFARAQSAVRKIDEQIARYKEILNEKIIIKLVKTYGSKIYEVLELAGNDSALSESIGESNVIAAQIIYAVRNEIAETFPRTEGVKVPLTSLRGCESTAN